MKTYRYMIGMLLCVWLLAACDNSNAFDEYAKFDTTAQTAWGQSIVDGSNGYVAHVKSDRTYNLADGVDVLEMAFLADDGLAMQLFLFKIALSDKITLRTTLADDKNQVGTGQTIMKQLEAMQKNGKKVLGGTNADFFNTTYIPYGVCYRDGVAVKTPGDLVFPYVQNNVDHIITIPDTELVDAFLDMMEKHKMIVENAGLLTVAALKHLDCKGKNVVSVLSGGNMDVITMSSLVQHGLIGRGRILTFAVQLPDRPGELMRGADVLARNNGNIIKLEHNQFVNINRQSGVELRVTLEAFGHDHKKQILQAMRDEGYQVAERDTGDLY